MPKLKRTSQLLNSPRTLVRDLRGRFASPRRLMPGYTIYSRETGAKLLILTAKVIPKEFRVRKLRVPSGKVHDTNRIFAKYNKLHPRGRPSKRYFNERFGVFTSRKRENGAERFETAVVFFLVSAPFNAKTSEKAPHNTQIWITRIHLAKRQSIAYWSENLKPGEFIYEDVKELASASDATLLEIVGFEGVR